MKNNQNFRMNIIVFDNMCGQKYISIDNKTSKKLPLKNYIQYT